MKWARQSCRAWGGRLARHRRHFHRLRVPEPGMRAAPESRLPGERRPHPDPPTAGRPLSGPRRARHSGEGRTATVSCCAGIAVCLSPPGTGGVPAQRWPRKAGRGRAVRRCCLLSPRVAMLYPHLSTWGRRIGLRPLPSSPRRGRAPIATSGSWWIRASLFEKPRKGRHKLRCNGMFLSPFQGFGELGTRISRASHVPPRLTSVPVR
jgi:hypothetical protein